MLNNNGFDLWADNYDNSVRKAEEGNVYPFAGYTSLMNAIYGTVMAQAPVKVLDIGFGTAMLTSKLCDAGNQITGIDFSMEMIKIAADKMPEAKLLQWDFSMGVPPELSTCSFDFIISTYALHHLGDQEKVKFLIGLLDLLEPGGSILIGDVGFNTRDELLACKTSCGEHWDDDEFYFVFSELQASLSSVYDLSFHHFSFCAGVIEMRRKQA